ncbi:MAG: peptidylprolyl isomerase [Gammaproteobacteria bacterium]
MSLSVGTAAAQLVYGPGPGAKPQAAGDPLDNIVAVVNEDIITRRELNAALADARQQINQRKSPAPPVEALERQVLERLIVGKLELRAAELNGITIDDQSVNTALEQIAQRNNLNLSQLRARVEKDGMSFAQYRDSIRQQLLGVRLRQKVVDNGIQVSDQEVSNVLTHGALVKGARQYHIAQILIGVPEGVAPDKIDAARAKADQVLIELRKGADFKRLAATVSDDRQALEGGDLGWRGAEQLPALFADVVPKLQPGEISDIIRSPGGFHIIKLLETRGADAQTAQTSLQTLVRHILIAPPVGDKEAEQRLATLRARIKAGADFGELARANSSDKQSAARGGVLGWVAPGNAPPEIEEQIAKLQPGEVSQPFKTRFGWHILQVMEQRERAASDEAQRNSAREALFRRKAEDEWEMWLRRLREEAYVEIRL